MPGKCVFNKLWLDNTNYKEWILTVDDDPHKAKCSLCMKQIDLARMGESALRVHMKGKLEFFFILFILFPAHVEIYIQKDFIIAM